MNKEPTPVMRISFLIGLFLTFMFLLIIFGLVFTIPLAILGIIQWWSIDFWTMVICVGVIINIVSNLLDCVR